MKDPSMNLDMEASEKNVQMLVLAKSSVDEIEDTDTINTVGKVLQGGGLNRPDQLDGIDADDAKTLGTGLYAVATFVHVAATVFFAVMVIRDMVHPEHDPVRGDGIAADADDPGGGPFDGAPDALTLAGVSRPNPEPRRTVKS